MNVLFAASELTPYAKTGGLGDVLAALPPVLRKRGHSVGCVLPMYRGVLDQLDDPQPSPLVFPIQVGLSTFPAKIWTGYTQDRVRIFLVQRDEFFDRSHLYGGIEGDYGDNCSRFIFFSKAVVELARHLSPVTQILHVHDWQTGLVPAFVRARSLPMRTVFTIHNLAYQGAFWGLDFGLTNLPSEYFSPPGVEFYGQLNFLKAGILLANQVTTVSPRYAEEIQTEWHGCGLHHVLREQRHKLTGILNGVDYSRWNPQRDPHLPASYSPARQKGKLECKRALLERFQLPVTEAPVFASVTRLAHQKGVEVLAGVVEDVVRQGGIFILVGSGDPWWEGHFRWLASRFPQHVAAYIGFDEALSHLVEAGADFFLMPSHYEPCGLTQMYSLHYGAVPIAHRTGGLADSIRDYHEETGEGTGFLYSPNHEDALRFAIQRALRLYTNKEALTRLRRQGMNEEFSWDRSAPAYEAVYQRALAA